MEDIALQVRHVVELITVERVIPGIAVENIVATAAVQRVVPLMALERVIASTAIEVVGTAAAVEVVVAGPPSACEGIAVTLSNVSLPRALEIDLLTFARLYVSYSDQAPDVYLTATRSSAVLWSLGIDRDFRRIIVIRPDDRDDAPMLG